MATVSQLRQQAKARKVKGYSKMNKSQLMSALGVSDDRRGDMRARESAQAKGIAKKHGIAQSFAADRLAEKLAQSSPYKHSDSPAGDIKGWLLDRVKSDLRKAQRKNGGKPLSQDQKRAVAVKALKDEATAIRKKHAELNEYFNQPYSKPQAEPAKAEKSKEKRSTAATKPKAEPKPKAEKKPKAEPKEKTAKKPAPDDPTNHPKRHSIKSQEDFNDLALHTFDKLSKSEGGMVPIYKIRRAIGEMVPRDKFSEYMFKLQGSGKLNFLEGSVEDNEDSKLRDSLQTNTGKLRAYATLGEKGGEALEAIRKNAKTLEKKLEDGPELDPLGRAGALRQGKPIKNQEDFDSNVSTAFKHLNEDFNQAHLVPIHELRKALGDRVNKADFDKYIGKMQANDKIHLLEEGTKNSSKEMIDGAWTSPVTGKRRLYAKLTK